MPHAHGVIQHQQYYCQWHFHSSILQQRLSVELTELVTAAVCGCQVRTMQEHEDVTKEMLTKDVIWDAPPILTRDRDDLRVAAYLAKSIAYLTLYPRLVQAS